MYNKLKNNKGVIACIIGSVLVYLILIGYVWELFSIKVVTVDLYSADNKWVIGNELDHDKDGRHYTSYFCTENDKGYNIGDTILVIYNKDEIFDNINVCHW